MKYEGPLETVRFVARRKRFLCDVERPDGTAFTAHLANTGSMRGCMAEGAPVRVRDSGDAKRKLPFSVEQIQVDGDWIIVNTARANQVVAEALADGAVPELAGLGPVRREVTCADSRIDFALGSGPRAWVEVKSVTLREGERLAFPDAVTTRGRRHVEQLAERAAAGERAVLLFVVAREGGVRVELAEEVDPLYARSVRGAAGRGVEVLAYRAVPQADGIVWGARLPVRL